MAGPQGIRLLVAAEPAEATAALAQAVAQPGWAVSTPSSVARLADAVRTEQPHLVLLQVPALEGPWVELLEKVRGADRDVALVVATVESTLESALLALRLGVNDYLPLPATPDALRAALVRALTQKGLAVTDDAERLKRLGRAMRDARHKASLTLQQLARRTGVSVSLLSQIERAETAASVVTLFRLSNALRRPLAELLREV
ncbi:MAG: helix-turn-helix domain-containing protein [Myxococcaceae bacterium]|nr:helix-turn-helix domain-containing protein [Myxococcaceae bacterium]